MQRKGTLVKALFHILEQHPDGLKARDAIKYLERAVPPTEFELGRFNDNSLRFDKIVRFATIAHVRAGWLAKDSGRWLITAEGSKALAQYTDPTELQREAQKRYHQWKAGSVHTDGIDVDISVLDVPEISVDNDHAEINEDNSSVTFEQAEDQAREDIERYLATMPPFEFQNVVGDLLRAMGYFVDWIAPPGPDGGVDIVAHTDPLGTQGPRIKVQVKRQQQSVNLPGLKSFMASIGPHDAGIFFCTGGFTKDAANFAREQESKRIMLINADKFIKLWIEYTPKLGDRAWQRLPLTPIYFLTPQE